MRRLLIAGFWGALLFAVVMALLPKPPQLPGSPNDKVQHIIAFAVLTALAALAYPKASALRIAAGLALLGAGIELGQMVPALHRDASLLDLLADCSAVVGVLLILRVRRLFAA